MIPRIAIGTPTRDGCEAMMEKSLSDMIGRFSYEYVATGQAEICRIVDMGSILPDMRNSIVKKALDDNCTHLLWIDSDMVFPTDLLERLLNHNKQIVAAGYAQRSRPSKPVAAKAGYWCYTTDESTGLEQVDFVGQGCMLVDTDVYRHLEKPWHTFAWNTARQRSIGEDVYFCRKAADIGAFTFLDHDLTKEIGHIGKYVFTYKDALDDRKLLAEQQRSKDPSKVLMDDPVSDRSPEDKSAA